MSEASRAIFRGLVERIGGVDAAAATIEARLGACSKGTVSKMCAGHIGVTVEAMRALEDGLGAFPLTTHLFERVGRIGVTTGCLHTLAAQSSIEAGEVHAAIIRAFSHASADPNDLTPTERAEVMKELREAIDVMQQMLTIVESDPS
ncbi:hypothetical protein FHY55_19380 [Oceanicola sp. D3]|uniref:hypothetical protein n=1 Tax=Oceanicola sp. D3 TaxID=2587163 RepID=UPI0011217C70|nr:hypothetical protein [Oceanicola sp. D3]QDC11261.1 hypothetical protein FHY55_19380 [Oceanicola sp. D3]